MTIFEDAKQQYDAAKVALQLRDSAKARELYESAIALLSNEDRETGDVGVLTLLAECFVDLANVCSLEANIQGRYKENVRAQQLLVKLLARGQQSIELLLANTEANLGHDLLSSNSQAAERYLISSIEHFTKSLQPDHSNFFRVGFGKALYHYGMILQSFGDHIRAATQYERAEEVFLALVKQDPSIEHRRLAAAAAQNLSVMREHAYQMKESIEAGERAKKIYEELVREGSWSFFPALAQTLNNLAMSYYYGNDQESAIKIGRLATFLLKHLVEKWQCSDLRHMLNAIQHNLQTMRFSERNVAKDLSQQCSEFVTKRDDATEETLKLGEAVVRTAEGLLGDSWDTGVASTLALVLYDIGILQQKRKEPRGALAAYQKADKILSKLTEEGRFDLQDRVAYNLQRIASIHQDLGEHQEAISCYERAYSLLMAMYHGGRYDLPFFIATLSQEQARSYTALQQIEKANHTYAIALDIFLRIVELVPEDAEVAKTKIAEIHNEMAALTKNA